MEISSARSAALPVARLLLRVIRILNLAMVPAIVTLLVISVVNEDWLMRAFKLLPSAEAYRVLMGLRVIAVLGLVAIPFQHVLFTRLLAIVDTVRSGDPFTPTNAQRLWTIGWALVALNVLSTVIGLIGDFVSTKEYPLDIDAGFSVNGWLAVLLTFVLARVFAEGARMREDLEGTI